MTIYLPTGTPSHIEAELHELPNDCEVQWTNTTYADGHREGVLYLPNGQSYAVTS